MEREEDKREYELVKVEKPGVLAEEVARSYYEPDEEQVHLRDYLDVLRRRKWVAIVFLVVVVATVTIGSFIVSPKYKATATIQIGNENPNVLTFKDIYQIERPDDDYYQTQFNILKSRALAQRVIGSISKENKNAISSFFTDDSSDQSEKDLELQNAFLDNLEVDPIKNSQLVDVSFIALDPTFSAMIANKIASEYIDFTLDNKLNATRQARKWLEKQIEELQGQLESSEEKLNDYVARNQIIFLNQEKDYESVLTKQLSELSTTLSSATAERIKNETLFREIDQSGKNAQVLLDSPVIQSLIKEKAKLETEYADLSQLYKPDYPKMVRLTEQISKIGAQIENEKKAIIESVEMNYRTSVKREEKISSTIDDLQNKTVELQKKLVQYQILQREVETNRELYESLLQRLKEVGVSASLSASNIIILDHADVPIKPHFPRKGLNIAVSIIIGLFGGVFLAFFVEYLDNTIKNHEFIEKKVHLPILGLIPVSEEKDSTLRLTYGKSGVLAEAFRSIGTYIQFASVSRPPKTMLVTSPLEQEGKTTLSMNLSKHLVDFMGKGLIIDADLRKPQIHRILGMNNSIGLSSYLSGHVSREEIIRQSTFEGLDVITSGPIPPNPSELLGSALMRKLVDYLETQYDFIILDSAPVLGMSDSLIVSTFVDGVVVVVFAGKTPKDTLIQTKKMLNGVNAKIIGTVLNGIDKKTHYGYYSYYFSDYGESGNGQGKS